MPRDAQGPGRRRRSRERDDNPVDLTSMIDVVFLLLIFFMVTSTMAGRSDVDVPDARNAVGVDPSHALMLTLAAAKQADAEPAVYLGDGTGGRPVASDAGIKNAIEAALADGIKETIVKAERRVPHRDVMRVARLVAAVEGMRLRFGVKEKR